MLTLTWVGHTSFLVQMAGLNILIDPVWSERASPLPFLGPRRWVSPGVEFDRLPPIDLVVLSHDHYDHLDRDSVQRLAATHRPRFFVPLGYKTWFTSIGVTDVVELDWWQSVTLGPVRVHCVPAQHFSQRSLWDASRRLWASWVIAGPERRLYFGGDTGYPLGVSTPKCKVRKNHV